jgi:mRNA-degrading endonuclease toxin of MazEF toxin-antitoxin module
VDDLDVGRIVIANMLGKSRPAIVLSTKEEIESTDDVHVVPISGDKDISRREDLVRVPHRGLGMKKECYVQCSESRVIPANQVIEAKPFTARGPFLVEVQAKVRADIERRKQQKSTQ